MKSGSTVQSELPVSILYPMKGYLAAVQKLED